MLGRSVPFTLALGAALALGGCLGAPSAPPDPAREAAPSPAPSPVAVPATALPPAPSAAAPAAPSFPLAEPEAPVALPVGPYEFATSMGDGAFEHARLDAQTQVTVRWTNRDNITHSVVSQDGRFAGSGPIAPGSDFTATFLTPGDYSFYCRYHGAMLGVVIVR